METLLKDIAAKQATILEVLNDYKTSTDLKIDTINDKLRDLEGKPASPIKTESIEGDSTRRLSILELGI